MIKQGVKEAVKFSEQTKVSSRLFLIVISILLVSNLFLLFTFQQASRTLYNLNTANQNLDNLLIRRDINPTESSQEVYHDLEQIGCIVSELVDTSVSSSIELDDYSTFLTLAHGNEVKMNQDFTFKWNPLQLTWMDNVHLLVETSQGIIGWSASYMHIDFIEGIDSWEIFEKKVARRREIIEEHSLFDTMFRLDESEANILGGRFLRSLGYETIKGSFVKLETRTPNTFWYDLAGVDAPNVQGERECWVFWSSLEDSQGNPLGGYEVWIDVHTSEIIGGDTT